MKVAVCLKQVPDTTNLRLDPETNTMIREGVAAILNPLDLFPLEAAVRLREQVGTDFFIAAFTMGPPQAQSVLRRALAMGADDVFLLSDRAFAGADTWATSLTLAAAIRDKGPFDLVLCGKQAIDGDTAQVGPGIAAHLHLPQVTYVTRIELCPGGKSLRLRRLLDHGTADLNVRLPAVLTVLKEANEPRLPTLAGRLNSYARPVTTLTAVDLGLDSEQVGLSGSPTRVIQIRTPDTKRLQLRVEGGGGQCTKTLADIIQKGIAP